MKIDKVLAMDKWQQANFLFGYTNQGPYEERRKDHWGELAGAIDSHDAGSTTADYLLERALSHLAFRLRDDACKLSCEKYNDAIEAVYKIRYPKPHVSFYAFCAYQITPIDMILAALKAKEEE